jgi:3-dehydroquinate synthase
MMVQEVAFPSGVVRMGFGGGLEQFLEGAGKVVMLTNEHVLRLYPQVFAGRPTITLPPGENTKDVATVAWVAEQLLQLGAGRDALLVAVGGGVITDIAGFAGSVFMRGIRFGFVPTTLLGMVDAAIGGKNGVNLNLHKNMLGTFAHPAFIYFDTRWLKTLPTAEWSNGFAEILKYAFIADQALYGGLCSGFLASFREDPDGTAGLIRRCVDIKVDTVVRDEKEKNVRKLLNYGHTVGHAVENLYDLPHGHAVAVGMVAAAMVSERVTGIAGLEERTVALLERYYLPTYIRIDPNEVMKLLRADKKRVGDAVDFIVLEDIGRAAIRTLPFHLIDKTLQEYAGRS